MKKSIFLLTLLLFLCQFALAQTGGINFQGLARNASGEVLVNQKITLRFSVLLSSDTGTTEYQESKEAITNAQGMFSLVIGEGSILTKTGNFSDINWKVSPKFLKVEMDPSAGANFTLMGISKLQAVPFAYYANGVDAENVQGVLPAAKGGTGVGSISALKGALQLDQVNNTADVDKPLSTAIQTALATKVDKVQGKELSTNDYTTAEKTKLAAITGTNTGDQDLSGFATTADLTTKANTSDVATALATKVDKVQGKDLSTNDYTTAEKAKLSAITGTNTGDQDLSGFATSADLNSKANATDVTAGLATKVDKVQGKELSTNDYTTAEKTKLAAITGTNTGDQDLSGFATTADLNSKANAADVTTALATKVDKVQGKDLSTNDYTTAEKTKLEAITGTNTGDQDLSGFATTADLNSKANASDVTTALVTKVDKVQGKELSTNDYTTAEKAKLAAITGTNTGDQDLSGFATTADLNSKANAADVTTALATKVDKVQGKELSTNDYTTAEKTKLAAITGTNTGDQINITGNAGTATLAQTVTTNANLTGPITSIGNTTSIASQTGTGNTFVMSNSPTLVSPALGTPISGVATNLTGLPLNTGVTGILAVANGGTGVTTLTGLVKGNGANAMTGAIAGTDYQAPITLTTTGSGAATLTGTTLNIPTLTNGTATGDMLYWNGTAWVKVAAGSNGQVLIFGGGKPMWSSYTVTNNLTTNNVVFNPITGRFWMDKNLGASRVATSSTDTQAYGDLYQWGRAADGHQLRGSATTTALSSSDAPGNSFILVSLVFPYDWRSPKNDNLWQGVNGTNNPCPSGFRIPTDAEWNAELATWTSTTAAGAFGSILKLPLAGYRDYFDGGLKLLNTIGSYWSSTIPVPSAYSSRLFLDNNTASMGSPPRAYGFSVRCIKD